MCVSGNVWSPQTSEAGSESSIQVGKLSKRRSWQEDSDSQLQFPVTLHEKEHVRFDEDRVVSSNSAAVATRSEPKVLLQASQANVSPERAQVKKLAIDKVWNPKKEAPIETTQTNVSHTDLVKQNHYIQSSKHGSAPRDIRYDSKQVTASHDAIEDRGTNKTAKSHRDISTVVDTHERGPERVSPPTAAPSTNPLTAHHVIQSPDEPQWTYRSRYETTQHKQPKKYSSGKPNYITDRRPGVTSPIPDEADIVVTTLKAHKPRDTLRSGQSEPVKSSEPDKKHSRRSVEHRKGQKENRISSPEYNRRADGRDFGSNLDAFELDSSNDYGENRI